MAASKPLSCLIVGASSGLGREIAGRLAIGGHNLVLVARDTADIDAVASDLIIRFGVQVSTIVVDLLTEFDAKELVERASSMLGGTINHSYLVAGGAFEDDCAPSSDSAIERSIRLNFTSVAKLLSALANNNAVNACNLITVISSIASSVPRSNNASYTASKIALESYAQSVRHSSFQKRKRLRLRIIRLGFMDSIFSYGLRSPFPIADPKDVATYLVASAESNEGMEYYPKFWLLVTLILRSLPWFIFKRIKF